MFSPFEFDEIKELSNHLFDTLLGESDRGAIIIGATKVEEQLSNYIRKILPFNSKTKTNKLLEYPGILSSFSAKIEMAYTFRLISKNLYNSLNSLRRLRNDAAHSSDSFTLNDLRERYSKIFELGPSVASHVRFKGMDLMMNLKLIGIDSLYEEYNLKKLEKEEHFKKILEDKETVANLERQVPKWELIYGLCIVCGFIKYSEIQTIELIGDSSTWYQLNEEDKSKAK